MRLADRNRIGRPTTWPFETLEVGETFFAEGRTSSDFHSTVAYWNSRGDGRVFRIHDFMLDGQKAKFGRMTGVFVKRVK